MSRYSPLIVLSPLADSDTPLGTLREVDRELRTSVRWLAVTPRSVGALHVVTADNGLPILLVVTIVVSSVQEPESDVSFFLESIFID